MPLFGRDRAVSAAPRVARTIPTLNPDFFRKIHESLLRNGGTDSQADIAAGVANAIFNTGATYLDRVGDRRGERDFAARFDGRSPTDPGAADAMIDWLLAHDPGTQEFLTTLIGRLSDVLSRPA